MRLRVLNWTNPRPQSVQSANRNPHSLLTDAGFISNMGILDWPRVPEPEVMSDEEETEAYASATALRHLETLDEEFVDIAMALGVEAGVVLDVGTGPAQIPIKLALRAPSLIIHGIDMSRAMLRKAAIDAGRWGVEMRILLNYGDAKNLPYDSGLFDMVLCNSVLHHATEPILLIREMARVCKASGALLLRDLRRPGRLTYRYHLWKHGASYEGRMRELFDASVRSAYTLEELRRLVDESAVAGLEVLRMGPAHIGFRRPRS